MLPSSSQNNHQSHLLAASLMLALISALLTLGIVGFGSGTAPGQTQATAPQPLAQAATPVAQPQAPTPPGQPSPAAGSAPSLPTAPAVIASLPTATAVPAPPTARPAVAPPLPPTAPATGPEAAPGETADAGAFAVTGFTLIDATTGQPILPYDPLLDGTTIDLAQLPTRNLTLRANTSPEVVGSVVFGLDGNNAVRDENSAPYVIGGDKGGHFFPWPVTPGTHIVSATPFLGANAAGPDGDTLAITFTLVDSIGGATGEPAQTFTP